MSKEDYYTVIGEEDEYNWTDNKTGLKCRMKRNFSGAWCGYVGTGPKNSFYMEEYQDLYNIDVHGGLTYAGYITGSRLWWLGFDCGHGGDLMPKMPKTSGTYRDVKYVKAECAKLAQQLTKI